MNLIKHFKNFTFNRVLVASLNAFDNVPKFTSDVSILISSLVTVTRNSF